MDRFFSNFREMAGQPRETSPPKPAVKEKKGVSKEEVETLGKKKDSPNVKCVEQLEIDDMDLDLFS